MRVCVCMWGTASAGGAPRRADLAVAQPGDAALDERGEQAGARLRQLLRRLEESEAGEARTQVREARLESKAARRVRYG